MERATLYRGCRHAGGIGLAMLLCVAATQTALAQSGAPLGRTVMYFPTGDQATSVLAIERITPQQVRSGGSFSYQVRVRNITRAAMPEISFTERFPAGMSVSSVAPQGGSNGGSEATWTIERLGPGDAFTAQIDGSVNQMDDLVGCATVRFATELCSTTRVVQPALVLEKYLPEQVIVCDPIPMRIVVRNTGTGIAENVQITDDLPAGLVGPNGQSTVSFNAGNLGPGQQREFTASLKAQNTGSFSNTANAMEAGGLTASASASTRVVQPVLQVSKTCPGMRFLGRPVEYSITVSNVGDAPARDAMLIDTIPNGITFSNASDGGQLSGGQVRWNLGTIEPGGSRTVSVTCSAAGAGVHENIATARAYCAEAQASCTVEVRGIPAILLEVVDVEDPDEVGTTETYIIKVLNQGSADGTNIRITCEVQPEAEYVSSEGPGVSATLDGRTVAFSPLPSLAPKATAMYRVIVKGVQAGDTRFKVSLTSDQINSPVEETESTHFY